MISTGVFMVKKKKEKKKWVYKKQLYLVNNKYISQFRGLNKKHI